MPQSLKIASYESPIGRLWLAASKDGAYALSLSDEAQAFRAELGSFGENENDPHAERQLAAFSAWLDGYFAGKPSKKLPSIAWHGTAFQLRVWQELAKLPFGALTNYSELGAAIGCKGPRAVGNAMGQNPLPILVPCHRVLAKGLGLGGFSGGLHRKTALLRHEGHRVDEPKSRVKKGDSARPKRGKP